eukprot:CAMPEP_0118648344 /NCGR_PEP_ID=MMETSP0785-20121206/9104_1 /TAXON_ID=91992 /ORGANISM="Bolidomonas pacifica, Strain CCMP 1866" /LENGTH=396 /DNA_ID=CAMNT_0006540527 /DNA_START=56 /DNA_END=1242 /DNA_ORIENTATION=+
MPPSTSTSSFTADSPYYATYISTQQSRLDILSSNMDKIAKATRAFNEAGRSMASATHDLATTCRVTDSSAPPDSPDNAFGSELTSILHLLGSVLTEVADGQLSLCESLAASLAKSLEAFAHTEKREAERLVTKAEADTQQYDILMGRYLHPGRAEKDDEIVKNTMTNLKTTFASMSRRNDKEALERQKVVNTATIKTVLDGLALQNCNAELSRFKYLRRMESLRERRTFELGEVMLASLHGIRAYFHHASDLTNGLTPKLTRLQATQAEKREEFKKQQEPWNNREHKLKAHIGEATAAVQTSTALLNAINEGSATGVGTTLIDPNDMNSLLKVEDESGVWKIGSALNSSSLYSRTPAKGVITEGWLYKKSTSRMHLHSWNKRWFVLDKEGLHYMRG